MAARLSSWLHALTGRHDPGELVSVGDLYGGDHWQVARALPARAAEHGLATRLWVCSAGYGLISGETVVFPYSATFSSNHPDSVWKAHQNLSRRETIVAWWSGLSEWSGPDAGAPRSMQGLAALDPGAAIWVIASETYLDAMRADLVAAAGTLRAAEQLALISAGTPRLGGLEQNQLKFDWRLQGPGGPLRGAAMSLNVRVAELLLQEGRELTAGGLNACLGHLTDALAPRERKMGKKVSPAEVESFIREELATNPAASRTSLLRKLRDERSWAFEEKRFGRLLAQVREAMPGGGSCTAAGDKQSRKPVP